MLRLNSPPMPPCPAALSSLWQWRLVDGSGYFPLRQPEEEAPFEGEKGTERAAQFAWCLGVRSPQPQPPHCSQAPQELPAHPGPLQRAARRGGYESRDRREGR